MSQRVCVIDDVFNLSWERKKCILRWTESFFFLPSLKVRFVRCDTLLFVFRTRRESDDLMEDIIARRRLMEVSDDFITR